MKVLIVGGTGKIGAAVATAFSDEGEEVHVASRSSQLSVDIADPKSVSALFERVGEVDAVVSATGKVPSVDIHAASIDDFLSGFGNKLAGQINLLLAGLPYITEGGSFTLTSGILAQHSIPGSIVTATVNGGLESFVEKAAPAVGRGVRVNAVSPTIVLDEGERSEAFRGFHSVSPSEIAQGYIRSVYGVETGQVFRVW